MLIHILTHEELIFVDAVLFFLCTGSFYLIYKFNEKYFNYLSSSLENLYVSSIIINLSILLIVIILQPDLLKNMFITDKNKWLVLLLSLSSIFFGAQHVKFELWLFNRITKKFIQNKKILKYVVLIAIIEEILFRGVINEIAMSVKNNFNITIIFMGAFFFGLSHLFVSSLQCISKIIFSFFMTAFYFLSGTIIVPIIAHAVFNYYVAKKVPIKMVKK